MKWITIPIEQALGHILCHNIADAQGHKALHKGVQLDDSAVAQLRALGQSEVTVAVLDSDDVHEDVAAQRLAEACLGEGVRVSEANSGRVNLLATVNGVLQLQHDVLEAVNLIDGLTIATLRHHTVVAENKMIATIKVIPYAVPEANLAQAEMICREQNGLLSVRPLFAMQVGVILAGSEAARERVMKAFAPAISARVEELGSSVRDIIYVAHQSKAIASAIELLRVAGAHMIIIAGETSIMDRADVVPQGIVQAGGVIEHYGAPVEPGNLLLLAYLDGAPIIGAPGCIRSRDLNVVDLVLPRLLTGERLSRMDIIALADGGLLL